MRKELASAMTILILGLGGCARHVVIDPELLGARNDRAWKIDRRAPPPGAVPVPAPPAAVTSEAAPASAVAPAPAATAPAPAAAAAPPPPPRPVPQPPPRPVPFRELPDVRRAQQTPTDGLDIPKGLYAVDPLLAAHRREMDVQTRSRRMTGVASVVIGLASVAAALFFLQEAARRVDSENSMTRGSAGGLYASGSLLGLLGLGITIAGGTMAFTGVDPTQLQNYYRETYLVR